MRLLLLCAPVCPCACLSLPVFYHIQVSLKYFEEVFTSEHWMMRIYRVRDKPNRDKPKTDAGRVRKPAKKAAKA